MTTLTGDGEAHMNKASAAKRMLIFLTILAFVSVGLVNATPPYPTTPATATVDGNPGEWDLTNDFFADMYRAGTSDKVVQSKLYLRYDPATDTLYVLVLAEPAYPGLREADEAWVKIDGAKKVDGTYADFAWVELNPPETDYVKGYEASFTLPEGSYMLDVHLNVYGDGQSQTSRTLKANIPLFVVPEGPIIALIIASITAFGLYTYKRKKQ